MRENFLHYLWKYKKFNTLHLRTTTYQSIELIKVGEHNFNSGPDFLGSLIKIDGQLWAGNIEIHIKSSSWYLHNHDKDKAYDTVILHVVWEHDADVNRPDGSVIPTLELKQYISSQALTNYFRLFSDKHKWINCEKDFSSIDDLIISNWLERLYFERLERKCVEINSLLESSHNDWEAVLFKLIAKNFGLYINSEAFLSMAKSIDFSIIRKLQSNQLGLEAIFFGQSGLLERSYEGSYYNELNHEYNFVKRKFKLKNKHIIPVKFLRLRPGNFPTIRLSQLSQLYYQRRALFSEIMKTNAKNDYYNLFSVSVSPYWKTHYNFSKTSKSIEKKVSKSLIDLLIINTIIPLKFSFAKSQGKSINDNLLSLIGSINSEENKITKSFNSLKKISITALHSQSLLQLKNEYCDKNKCLQCAVGNALLNRNM